MTNHGRSGIALATDQSGIALITTILVTMLISALVAGTFAAITADQRANLAGRDQTQVFAASHAALEKLTSDLAALFTADVSPEPEEIEKLTETPPPIPGFEYTNATGEADEGDKADQKCFGAGYSICFTDANNDNVADTLPPDTTINVGAYAGFSGLMTKYTIYVTARSEGGAEIRLRRELQTVAIPVFQFGVFSESNLTFYAGDNFDFGGRVHTNGHLFLSELYGFTLKFTDRITAVGDVIRAYLSNGRSVSSVGFIGTVTAPTSISSGTYRALATSEGTVVGMPGSASNASWPGSQYNGNILVGTDVKKLELPLVSHGAKPVDLIRRPKNSNEKVNNPPVFEQRYFSMASLRVLLSDQPEDITSLSTVTSTAPVELNGVFGSYPTASSIGPISAVVASGSTGSGANIRVQGSMPAAFRAPALTVGSNSNITCTTKTATQFSDCTPLTSAVSNGAVVSATLPSNAVVSTTMTSAASVGATTLNVNSTARFSPGLIWVNGTPVTCAGYDATPQFTYCAGLPGSPSAGQTISTHALHPLNTPLIGGYIKVEKQSATGVWSDVTAEILALGIGAPNQDGGFCADPTPNAILRLQRLRDNAGNTCTYTGSTNPHDWWPNTLYDTREGNYRDVSTTAGMQVGGVMHYVSLDVNNLKRWFAGTIGTTGTAAWNNNGYIVYFSDRRGDHNENDNNAETGEFGFEDVVNPASSTGAQNGTLDEGEDANESGSLDRWGESPWSVPATWIAPYTASARPWTAITNAQARVNRQVLFRRALKLVNGGIVSGVNSLPASGLTVAAENPVYVQGNYNATTSPTAEPNVPAAIIADAVSVLSNNWKDTRSFAYPNSATDRNATTTAYRFGVIAGKNRSFTYPTAGSPYFLFGTDGGVGNFLRLLEDWNISGVSINYRGSIISLYYSRQATGAFKYNSNVYNYGDRNFTFDTDFRTPSLLPPGTPMFRDINTLSFLQILRPHQ